MASAPRHVRTCSTCSIRRSSTRDGSGRIRGCTKAGGGAGARRRRPLCLLRTHLDVPRPNVPRRRRARATSASGSWQRESFKESFEGPGDMSDTTSESKPSTRRAGAHEVLGAARAWIGSEGRVALATVVGTWGSAPVPVGGQMVMAPDGRFEGSVSGGCVEGEIIAEAEAILSDGQPKTLTFGVADDTAWRVGLPCGGEIKVFVERLDAGDGLQLIERAIDARSNRRGILVRTRLYTGQREFFERGDGRGDGLVLQHLEAGESELLETPD